MYNEYKVYDLFSIKLSQISLYIASSSKHGHAASLGVYWLQYVCAF